LPDVRGEEAGRPEGWPMTRRLDFFLGASAVAIAGSAGIVSADAAQSQTSPDLKRFLGLSTILTGYTSLDPTIGAAYLKNMRANPTLSKAFDDLVKSAGFASNAPPKTLAALTAKGVFATPGSLALTSAILADWFSGVPGGATVSETWDDALAWKACTFTKPPATCGGQTGYWAKPPA
jgi:hypothetical protein